MDNKNVLEKAFYEIDVQQKKVLENFVNTDFLKLIGSAFIYLDDENLMAAATEKLTENQKKTIYEYVRNHKKTDDEVLDNVSVIFDLEGYNSAVILEKLKAAMNSLNFMEVEKICQEKEEENPLLVELIRNNTFVFEDLVLLDDRNMQRILRDVDQMDLAVALKDASKAVENKVFSNMSNRAAQLLKEDMEFMGPVKIEDVLNNQVKIANLAKRLIKKGEILVGTNAYVL